MPSIKGPSPKLWDQRTFRTGDEVYLKSGYDAHGKAVKYVIYECDWDDRGKNWIYFLHSENSGAKDSRRVLEYNIGRWEDRPQETEANTDLIEL